MNKSILIWSIVIAAIIMMYAFRFQIVSDTKGIFMNRWTGIIYTPDGQYLGQVGKRR